MRTGLLMFLWCWAGGVAAASFDCHRPTTPIETAICNDGDLSDLDEAMALSFRSALRISDDPEALKQSQQRWLEDRDRCTDDDCLLEVYRRRVAELRALSATTPISVEPTARSTVKGYVSRLWLSSSGELALGTVIPYGLPQPDEEYGFYLWSVANTGILKRIGFVEIPSAQDFAVSPDEKLVYVLTLWFEGRPKDRDYGVVIIDISQPQAPRVLTTFKGDFQNMHLTGDGKYLLLQRRGNFPQPHEKELLVVSTSNPERPARSCTIDYPRRYTRKRIYAYGFVSFPDLPWLGILDAAGSMYLFDALDPCKARFLKVLSDRRLGVTHTAGGNGRLYGGGNGVAAYDVAGELKLLDERWWGGVIERLRLDSTGTVLLTPLRNQTVVYRIRADGTLLECERYNTRDVGDVVTRDGRTLIVGDKGSIMILRRQTSSRCS